MNSRTLIAMVFLALLAGIAALGLPSSSSRSASVAMAATTAAPAAYTVTPSAPIPERAQLASWLSGNPQTIELQGCLSSLGYDVGTLDGIEGPKTRAATAAFEASAPLSDDQARRCWQGIQTGRLAAAVQTLQGGSQLPQQTPSPMPQGPTYVPQQPANGTPAAGYGDISSTTGLPRTQYVQGYTRKDGTYVSGYYRSHR